MIDFSKDFASLASSRLLNEQIVWLTTVDSAGTPQPRPVWFHFDGQTILIFSRPGAAKVKQIRANAAVAINLNSDFKADHVTVFLGEARLLAEWPSALRLDEYVEKYRVGIEELGFTPKSFLADYSTAIEIVLNRVRGF